MKSGCVEISLDEDTKPGIGLALERKANDDVEKVVSHPLGVAREDNVDADSFDDLSRGFRDGPDKRVEIEQFTG